MAEWSVELRLLPRRRSLSSSVPPDGVSRAEWLDRREPWRGLRGVKELLDREFAEHREGDDPGLHEWRCPATTEVEEGAENWFQLWSDNGEATVFGVQMDLRSSRTEVANVVLRIADDVSGQIYIGELDEFVSARLLDFTEALARTRAAQFVRGREA